jgi:Domain of unknown function (DUF4360)
MKRQSNSLMKFATVAALLASSISQASIWGSWGASGTACNNGNVQVIDSGSTVSILFDEFGVSMPQNQVGDGLQSQKTCNFRIQLTPPRGFYLARLRQVFSGGVLKSTGSQAKLDVRYFLAGGLNTVMSPIVFPSYQAISPSNSASVYTRTVTDNMLAYACGGSTTYGLNMKIQATRQHTGQHVLMNLDSVDTSFTQRVELVPEWLACP